MAEQRARLAEEGQAEGLVHHSIKRVKKKINDFILNNYNKLFFNSSSKVTPQQNAENLPNETPANEAAGQEQTLSAEEILSNPELLKKVEAELRLCDDRNKAPRELL